MDTMKCPVDGYQAKDKADMDKHLEMMMDDPEHKKVMQEMKMKESKGEMKKE